MPISMPTPPPSPGSAQARTAVPRRPSLPEGYPAPAAAVPAIRIEAFAPAPPAPAPAPVAHPAPGAGAASDPEAAPEVAGVYIISVAARLLEMHPQTLRKYERLGLIQPVRTVGMLRLYSPDDLRKVMLIRHLMDNLGLNLAGVEFALKLVNNLNVFSRRLTLTAAYAGDAAAADRIREEVALLCASLSLPPPA